MMNELIIYLLITVIAILLGIFVGGLLAKVKSEGLEGRNESLQEINEKSERTINELQEEIKEVQLAKEVLVIENTKQESQLQNLQLKYDENQKDVEKLQEKFTKEFENLANKILEEKSSKFTEKNKENLATILNPLKERIEGFEKKVETTHKESIDYHAALRQQIIGLKELNLQMSKEAVNLTKALKGDSKAQGDWGETQLQLLLEKANLTRDIHYTTQGGYRDEENNLKKPDFVINLPDNRHLIIDSKVSLTAYEAYFNEEDSSLKEEHLKKHIESIRKHFKELSEKKYADLYGINSPDYVLMFVPIEPALMLALGKVNNLYLEALDKNVVLVSTSTLLATLSTVSSLWRQENQKKNVIEIARQAGALYDKFEGLLKDLIGIGKKIDDSKKDYNAAMNKLVEGRGNLINSVEKLKKLGAKTEKSLPENIIDRAADNN